MFSRILRAALFAAITSFATRSNARESGKPRAAVVVWSFNTGSAVPAAPAVAPSGIIYVGTGDGSVEAINPDGVLRWSYMVDGSVEWAPVIDATGRLYVATSAQRLYSFPGDGLGWQVRTPVHLASDPVVVVSGGGILFGGSDASVWAYSARGAALWHAPLGAAIVAGPVSGAGGHAMVATSAGDVWFLSGAVKRAVAHLGNVVRAIGGVFPDGSGVVLCDHTLLELDAHGSVRWQREGIEWASADPAGTLAVDAARALVQLRADGTEQSRTPLGVEASDAPVRGASGEIYVPAASGVLVIVSSDGVRQVAVSRASLHRPVLDPARHRVIVASGSGVVASVTAGD